MSAKAVEKTKGSGKLGVRICKDGGERYHRTPTRAEAAKLAGMINVELGRKSLELIRRATILDALLAIYQQPAPPVAVAD